MSQPHTIPDMDAFGRRVVVQNLPGNHRSLIGADQRHNQIQLRAGIENPPDAAQNSIRLSKCTKTIDIDGHKARRLSQQVFVCHVSPRHWARKQHDTVGFQTQSDSTEGSSNRHNTLSCAAVASVPHHLMLIDASVIVTDHSSFIFGTSEFAATPSECAPAADLSPCLPAAVGAINSISTRAR